MEMDDLFEKIRGLSETIPMHMPGHKRNTTLSGEDGYLEMLGAGADVTEIEGFDDLNNPRGLFAAAMKRAAAVWGSGETLFCVNGGTGGVLASIAGALPRGGKAIVARNCHISVYNALELAGADAVYALPALDGQSGMFCSVEPGEFERLLEKHPDARLAVVTSPTYEGIVSDIRRICEICHAKKVPVLVDEAHGGHFGFGYGFPQSAVDCGADIVVHSLHKTLAGLTQTAVIHLNGDLVDRAKIKKALAVFQSSSPSYLLSASIVGCVELLERRGRELFESWKDMLERFYARAANLRRLKVLSKSGEMFDFDRSKIVILTCGAGMSGGELAGILRRRYKIETEMAAPAYVLALTGIGDREGNLRALAEALEEIDRECSPAKGGFDLPEFALPEKVMTAAQADACEKTEVSFEEAAGQISGEYVMAYPPGVPVVVPGERITKQAIALVRKYESCGIRVKSTFCGLPEKVLVIKT